MKKILSIAVLAIAACFNTTFAQEKTTLSAQIYGYKGDMVYFDCMQTQ